MEALSGFLAVTSLALLVYLIYMYIRHHQRTRQYLLPPGPKGDFYTRANPGKRNQDTVAVPMYKFGDLFTIQVYSFILCLSIKFCQGFYKSKKEQECIPLGCVPSAPYRMRGLCRGSPWTETHPDRDPTGQRPPWSCDM